MDLMGALGASLEYLGGWIPRPSLIQSNEAGVRFWLGRPRVIWGPKLSWECPNLAPLETIPVARQTLNLVVQSLMTKDNREVAVAGVVVYEITDPIQYLVKNWDAEESIGEVAGAVLRDVVTSKTLQEIQKNYRNTTDSALTREAQEALGSFGIAIDYVRLTDFSTCRTLNLVAPLVATPNE